MNEETTELRIMIAVELPDENGVFKPGSSVVYEDCVMIKGINVGAASDKVDDLIRELHRLYPK